MTSDFPLMIRHEHTDDPGLDGLVEQAHALLIDYAHELDVAPFDLAVILSGDITTTITNLGEAAFTPERVGGTVVGKTLPRTRDYAQVDIVLDANIGEDSPLQVVEAVMFLAHEYAHVFIGRLRAKAGTRPAPPVRLQTPSEIAAILAYEAADEYRCDLFANSVLDRLTITVDDGEPQPVTLATLRGGDYFDELAQAHDQIIYPGWADLVDAYRREEIDPLDMFFTLVQQSGSVLKLLAHADATACSAGLPPILDGGSNLRGLGLYVAEAWPTIQRLLEAESQPIPTSQDFEAADRAIQAAGAGIERMWEKLGITWTPDTDGYSLHVRVPMR